MKKRFNAKKKIFGENDLKKVDVQYTIFNKSTSDFKPGDKVFLKSNPDLPLEVSYITNTEVVCSVIWALSKNTDRFPPECILHYEDAAFVTIKERFEVCLN